MAKQPHENDSEIQPALEQPITANQLLELFAKMNSENSKALAQAIVEARKPWVDPNKEENDRLFRESNRRMKEAERQALKANQAACPHIAGSSSLSEFPDMYSRTSIVWHELDSTEVIGVCTTCLREFRETDEDYSEWRRKQSINRMSKSGQRQWPDPTAAKARARA